MPFVLLRTKLEGWVIRVNIYIEVFQMVEVKKIFVRKYSKPQWFD